MLDPGVEREARYRDPLFLPDVLHAQDEMMRAAFHPPHRHVAIAIADSDAVRQHQSPHTAATDVPHEACVVGWIGFDRIDPAEVAEYGARNRCGANVGADVDHGAADCKFPCFENLIEWKTPATHQSLRDPLRVATIDRN